MFGNVVGKTRRVKIEEVEDAFLKADWEGEWIKEGVVENFVVSTENDWTAHQVWGFEKMDGVKRYVRHLVLDCPKRGKKLEKKLVYDYVGPLVEKEEFEA